MLDWSEAFQKIFTIRLRSTVFQKQVFYSIFGILALLLPIDFPAFAIDTIENTKVNGAVSFPKKFDEGKLSVTQSRVILLEEYSPSPIPSPKGFATWSPEKRSEWYSKWQKTKAGQEFRQREEKRFANLKKHESKIEKDFKFSFGDVKSGAYDLAGELLVEYENREYVAEFFANVKVSDVQEIDLKKIELTLTRNLRVGDSIPALKAKSGEILNQKQLADKNTLVVFWSRTHGIKEGALASLARVKREGQVHVVAVGVGAPPKSSVAVQPGADFTGYVESIDSDICTNWGVRALPLFWLVDRKGKILATPEILIEKEFKLDEILKR